MCCGVEFKAKFGSCIVLETTDVSIPAVGKPEIRQKDETKIIQIIYMKFVTSRYIYMYSL